MVKFLKYGAVLIGVYLVVANQGAIGVARESFTGAGGLVKAFQGRG